MPVVQERIELSTVVPDITGATLLTGTSRIGPTEAEVALAEPAVLVAVTVTVVEVPASAVTSVYVEDVADEMLTVSRFH